MIIQNYKDTNLISEFMERSKKERLTFISRDIIELVIKNCFLSINNFLEKYKNKYYKIALAVNTEDNIFLFAAIAEYGYISKTTDKLHNTWHYYYTFNDELLEDAGIYYINDLVFKNTLKSTAKDLYNMTIIDDKYIYTFYIILIKSIATIMYNKYIEYKEDFTLELPEGVSISIYNDHEGNEIIDFKDDLNF